MPALGRLVDHDERSRQFRTQLAARRLKAVDWDDDAPISDQGEVGACTGFTALDLMNNQVFRRNRIHATGTDVLLPNNKGLDFYHQATLRDGIAGNTYPGQGDLGSSGLGAAKGLKFEKFITGYTHGFSMGDFLAALQHQPVMVGTLWTSAMSDPDKTGLIRPTGNVEGGHEYGAFGYNPATQLIKFRNHWTAGWGFHGRMFMRVSDFEKLLADQGDVTIPVPMVA